MLRVQHSSATEQTRSWRNITEFACTAAGGCFAEHGILFIWAGAMNCIECGCVGKKHGRDVLIV